VLQALCKFERDHPQWFSPPATGAEFRQLYASGFMRILSGRDKVGRRVSILLPQRMPCGDAAVPAETMMRWNSWALERLGRDPYFQVFGAAVYENFEHMTMRQGMALKCVLLLCVASC
jgi:hypothetical protein